LSEAREVGWELIDRCEHGSELGDQILGRAPRTCSGDASTPTYLRPRQGTQETKPTEDRPQSAFVRYDVQQRQLDQRADAALAPFGWTAQMALPWQWYCM